MAWSIPKRAVLVPYDFSPACRWAIEVARAFVAGPEQIAVLHVVHPPIPTTPGIVWGAYDEEDLRARAHEALRGALAEGGEPRAHPHVAIGTAAHEIVDFAREAGTDLIVIPSHSRKGIERLLLGSVSERVVRLAPCPVLVLRGEGPEVAEDPT